ncbi:22921_t:CDS:2 [Gigaspora margarita]|uniref:22921_t:CDS:1 n=1 Tax=Gigaspora margarita TaxID=4874 RepID=A0ABM8W5Y5_GIGMA|nr:22921_t:CDS:2 [Gigaspora margarita]
MGNQQPKPHNQNENETSSKDMLDAISGVAKYGFVKACGAMPFIGDIAADVAQKIIDTAECAHHNEEVCRDISERVKESLNIISKYKPRGDIEGSKKIYEDVLMDIKSFVEMNKSDNNSDKKMRDYLKKLVNANKTSEVYKNLIERLNRATNNFLLNVHLENNHAITNLEAITIKIDDKVSNIAEVMLLQKGANTDVKDLIIDPSCLEDCRGIIERGRIKKWSYNGDEVAVKKMDNIALKDIAKQAKIVMLLSRWEPIEKFIGAYCKNVDGKDCLFVVTEWMENGDLQKYLAEHKPISISWKDRIKIAEQIAKGLTFCITNGIYHRDIRRYIICISGNLLPFDTTQCNGINPLQPIKNVLLNENLDAKLTNFNMTRRIEDPSRTLSLAVTPSETYGWTAPEKIEYPMKNYTDKCELPFDNIKNNEELFKEILAGKRPTPFSTDTPEQYREMVEQAWDQDPDKRPKIKDLRTQLEQLKKFY